MEVSEGECLCDSLGWLEGRRSKNNWLLLLPSSCGFTSFSANDWQRLYYGQTLKDKLALPEYVRVLGIAVCVCVDALDVYVQTEMYAHRVTHLDWNQPYKCEGKLEYIWDWFEVPLSSVCGVASSTHLLTRRLGVRERVCVCSVGFLHLVFCLGKHCLAY